jgi:hypothetical protein
MNASNIRKRVGYDSVPCIDNANILQFPIHTQAHTQSIHVFCNMFTEMGYHFLNQFIFVVEAQVVKCHIGVG